MEEAALGELFEQVKLAEETSRAGVLIEAGCALGGSAIVIAAAKSKCRPLFVYDLFGMIPPPSERDEADVHERYRVIKSGKSGGIGGKKYYGYVENLFDTVTGNFSRLGLPIEANNVHLIKGLFQDTLQINEPVALAHLDGDWFDSVMTCLQRIEPYLVKNGVLVIDDYDRWSGSRKAVDEYFKDKQNSYEFVRKSRLHIIRK